MLIISHLCVICISFSVYFCIIAKKPLCIQWLILDYSSYVLFGFEEAAELSEEFL